MSCFCAPTTATRRYTKMIIDTIPTSVLGTIENNIMLKIKLTPKVAYAAHIAKDSLFFKSLALIRESTSWAIACKTHTRTNADGVRP